LAAFFLNIAPIGPCFMQTTSRSVALVANGAIHDYSAIKTLLTSYSRIIAVDGGINHCMQMNVIPSLIIGDLDSTSAEILSKIPHIPVIKHPPDKDLSDMELALIEALSHNPSEITLFGALGTRADHSLANLYLLTRYEHTSIETEYEKIFPVRGTTKVAVYPGQTLSFIPLGPGAKGVTLKGLKWEVRHQTFDHSQMSLSNVAIADFVEIEIEEGSLICCLQKK
jgi:thiamine pyrophosphokinase